MWNLRNWKTAWILSVILPISLLATFRFTGTISGPVEISETVIAETASLNITRPEKYRIFNELIENLHVDAVVSINFSLIVGSYHENEPGYPSDGKDDVSVGAIMHSNVNTGFIYSAKILFSKVDINAALRIPRFSGMPLGSIKLGNLKAEKIQYRSTDEQGVYIEAMGIGQPRNCTLEICVFWVFLDENNVKHETIATLELVHFNGVHYRKVVIPIRLEVV